MLTTLSPSRLILHNYPRAYSTSRLALPFFISHIPFIFATHSEHKNLPDVAKSVPQKSLTSTISFFFSLWMAFSSTFSFFSFLSLALSSAGASSTRFSDILGPPGLRREEAGGKRCEGGREREGVSGGSAKSQRSASGGRIPPRGPKYQGLPRSPCTLR